jgi:O-antigen/teichoic acid export membrane protein
VVSLEIADLPDSGKLYQQIYRHYTSGLLLIILGLSLFARPVLMLIAAPAFASAADLIPILCLAVFFTGLSEFFTLPAMLKKQTYRILPGAVGGAAISILLNVWLIPQFGVLAAAWVSVTTCAVSSGLNCACCRSPGTIRFPFIAPVMMLVVMIGIYLLFLALEALVLPPVFVHAVAALLWLASCVGLFLQPALQLAWLGRRGGDRPRQDARERGNAALAEASVTR